MTEYNYSPEAFEHYNLKAKRIGDWVGNTHQYPPADPFRPLPGEPVISPSDSISRSGSPPLNPYYPQQQPMVMLGQPQHYLSPPPYYGPPQQAYYATPQGMISPTYSAGHGSSSSRRHRSNRHGHHHSSGSRSHHASPSSGSIPLPSGLGTAYVPTTSLTPQSTMSMARSYSTPPHATASYFEYSPYGPATTNPYVVYGAQQQQLMQPAQMVYPASASASPYVYTTPNGSLSPYSAQSASYSRPSSSHSHSHSHSHRSSRSQSRSRSYSQALVPASSSSTPWMQPNPNQPLVVPFGNGGHVIVPARGQPVSVIVSCPL
ncbi:hypothetical protein BDZ97DRAFT_1853926 [Flammula alnicola]|nr:hypothetical protein BDZ97DRAFT_1853926 [Flammula alnicola]